MALIDVDKQFSNIKTAAIDAVSSIFPVEKRRHKMVLNKVWVDDKEDTTDYASQEKTKEKNGSWGADVLVDISLVDIKTGKVVDREPKLKLFLLPKLTDRSSYIVKGNEYQVQNQLRLRSGVYSKQAKSGEVKTQFNLAKGRNSEMHITPKGAFILKFEQAKIPLYSALVGLGFTDKSLKQVWGDKVFEQNALDKTSPQVAVRRLASALTGKKDLDYETSKAEIKSYIQGTEINPTMTKLTLGNGYDKFTPELWLHASKKLADVNSGKTLPDDVDNLAFKEFFGVDDSIKERIERNKSTLVNKINRNLDSRDKIKNIINLSTFSATVESFFSEDDRSATTDQVNPLHMYAGHEKITFMGPGAIKDEHSITDETRNVHSTHYGFLDPVHTPESSRIGVNLGLALRSTKDGNEIKAPFVDTKTKQQSMKSPLDIYDKVVAFPDSWDYENKKFTSSKVKAQHKGQVVTVDAKDVDYVVPAPQNAFSYSTNMIPFLASDNGNRSMMAGKHMEQAIALKNREVPLVQSKIQPGKDITFEEVLGKSLVVESPEDAVVKKVAKDHLILQMGKETQRINLYNNFTLNSKTFMNHEPVVKAGDKVKKGQLLAESNFTKDGVFALGTNLRAAYIPYKGYNFEDGIVITESASQKLTSEHIHKVSQGVTSKSIQSLAKFNMRYPNEISIENRGKLDDAGVIKVGSEVAQGDVLIAHLVDTGVLKGLEDIKATFKKSAGSTLRGKSEVWNYEFPGVVTKVVRNADEITVYVKTSEPAKIGDKLAGRHGNKGIITKVLPDADAPQDSSGKPVDIILNPHGVISRINIGQMYESAVGKVADKNQKVYRVDNFSGENYLDTVNKHLKKNNVDDLEELFEPSTGKSLGKIHVGKPYILKLNKQSEVQFSVRGEGGPVSTSTQQPITGGSEGSKAVDALTMYSLLSHGARANLREMATYKSENNPDLWEAIKYGRHLPAPKSPFVFEKFVNMLRASGVDVKKDGSKMYLAPLTDEQVKKQSHLEIKDPLFVRASGDRRVEEKGGLLDPTHLGGATGTNWGHIKLKEPVPNPIFEDAIKNLTNMTGNMYTQVLNGEKKVTVNGKEYSGGRAFKELLDNIDIDKELKEMKPLLGTLRGSKLNVLTKRYRYLTALKENNMTPSQAYIRTLIPVIPPKYRPVSVMDSGDLAVDDSNILYRNVALLNKQMNLPVTDLLDDKDLVDVRDEFNKNIKALTGLETIKVGGRDKSGFISTIKGSQPKLGFFQNKVLRKNQNLVGRGTIIPEPNLHMDEVALPEQMAWKLYSPFATKYLISQGRTATQAQEELNKNSPAAKRALEIAMSERPVMLNRPPSLHKFSIMAFKPKLTEGKAIKIPPLIISGFNADFDGDQMVGKVLVKIDNLDLMQHYNSTLNQESCMTARFKETVPYFQNGDLFIVDLQDFPHDDLVASKEGKNGLIDFYSVPEGIQVLANDEKTGLALWQTVSNWSVHHKRLIEVASLQSGRQIITDDDERAIYGIECGSLTYKRNTPTKALETQMFVPRVREFDATLDIQDTLCTQSYKTKTQLPLCDEIPLNDSFGYVLGVICGDGWSSADRDVCIAGIERPVITKFTKCLGVCFSSGFAPTPYEVINENSYGESIKHTFSNKSLSLLAKDLLGHGADNKHLPTFFLNSPRSFREGLFAGLIDTDGSISISTAKAKPQLMANYQSNSLRLAQEVLLLAKSLEINGRITASKTPGGNDCWMVAFSNFDIANKWGGRGIQHRAKLEKLRSIGLIEPSDASARYDIVPISFSLAEHVCKTLGAKRDAPNDRKSCYTTFAKAKKSGSLSRESAKSVNKFCNVEDLMLHPDFEAWSTIVKSTNIMWDRVVSIEKTSIKETGYDLTVPGYETFMNVEGIILSNTMTVHVPITDEAVREAYTMMPSRNLYKPGTGQLMVGPSQESQMGFYLMTKDAKGRSELNKLLPPGYKITEAMDKKKSRSFFLKLSKELPSEQFSVLIDTIKKTGELSAYEHGFTLGMRDLEVIPHRDKFLDKTDKIVSDLARGKITEDQFEDKIMNVKDQMETDINKHYKGKDNALYEMVNSGARGEMSQLQQITATPLIVQDARGGLFHTPVQKSFVEGLNFSDYWISSYGARKGMMDRALSTEEPGVFNKQLMSVAMDQVVTIEDCNTQDGIEMSTDSPEILGRFVQGNQSGVTDETVIDQDALKKFKRAGRKQVFVRSPLKCRASKGVCRHCYGIDENGAVVRVGDNVGAKTSQAIGEPMTQMVMNSFHTGGVAGSGKRSGADVVDKILHMTPLKKGKATLSTISGKVTQIDETGLGGYNIYVDGVRHTTQPGSPLLVHKGSSVSKGDTLTDGMIDSKELLSFKGLEHTQNYMTDELQKAYKGQNISIDRKTFETVIRAVTNRTQVKNDPLHASYLPGDVIPYTAAQEYNQNRKLNVPTSDAEGYFLAKNTAGLNKGLQLTGKEIRLLKGAGIQDLDVEKEELIHEPFLKGINSIPHSQKDWMAHMGATKIKDAIVQGASQGWMSDLKGYHPIPAYAYGAEFGEGEEGRY